MGGIIASPQSEVPSPNAERLARPRTKWALWSAIGLIMYGAYVALCFYMEAKAKARFQVPSKADIEAIDDRVDRIRTETARGHALADMRDWSPYAAYSIGVGVVVLLGTAIVTVLGARVVWRGVRRDSVRKARVIVIGVLLIMMGSLFLFGWPPLVAERRVEAKRTTFVGTNN